MPSKACTLAGLTGSFRLKVKFVAGMAVINQNTCLNHLRQIDAAKQQWALEKNKADAAVPTASDLLPYFKDGTFPACPDGGTYSINAVGEPPTCSLPGHALPQ